LRIKGSFFRKLSKACLAWFFIVAFVAVTPAYATNYQVTGLSDWYFFLDSTQEVTIYGNSDEGCNQTDWETTGTDPYLFLYEYENNGQDTYITEDDDANHDNETQCVSSKIVTTLDSGVYRLRAGYWDENSGSTIEGSTGNPDYEQDWGDLNYTLVTDLTLSNQAIVGPPMNLTGGVSSESNATVTLDWDAPNTGIVPVERYAISWRIPPNAGWGISTGNVGDADALNTEITIPFSSFESTGGLNQSYEIDIRADNDTHGYYSGWSNTITVYVGYTDTDGDGVYDINETEGCSDSTDCDNDGTLDGDDPDDLDPDVPVLTVDTDGDGVFDQEETEGCVETADCDEDGTDDFHDIDDLDPDVPVLTVDTDGDGVFDAEEENGEDKQTGEIVECRFFVDCDFDGTDDFDDPDDHDADIPVWTIDNDDDGVFDKGEEAGCVWDVDCDDDGTGDFNDPDDGDPDVPVWTIDTDADGVFDKGEEFGCADKVDCDFDGTFDSFDPDDFDPDVPFFTIDSDGDLVFDKEEFEQCINNPDCDFDGIEDFEDIDPLDPDSPFLTIDNDKDGVFDAEEELGCEFLEDCDFDGVLDKDDPDPLDPNVPIETVLIDGEEVIFEFIDEDTGEPLSAEEFFEEFDVAEEERELALELNDLGIDIEDVDLSEIDVAEEKVIEELDEIDEEFAEDFIDIVDGEITEEEIEDLLENEDAFEQIVEEDGAAVQVFIQAVNEADDSVKAQFEEEVDIFDDEAFNDYVAEGSAVDTETRRTVVAVTAATTAVAAATAATAARPSGPSPAGPSPSATGGGGGSAGAPSGSSGGDSRGSSRNIRRR